MDTICPICNGLLPLQESCPVCGKAMEDHGPLTNFFGPYSPYREIDDLKMSNGFPDLVHRQCIHVGYCENCKMEHLFFIQELL